MASDLVTEAKRTFKKVSCGGSRRKMADATRSLEQLYVDKEEAICVDMASEVKQASKDRKHSAAWKAIH